MRELHNDNLILYTVMPFPRASGKKSLPSSEVDLPPGFPDSKSGFPDSKSGFSRSRLHRYQISLRLQSISSAQLITESGMGMIYLSNNYMLL